MLSKVVGTKHSDTLCQLIAGARALTIEHILFSITDGLIVEVLLRCFPCIVYLPKNEWIWMYWLIDYLLINTCCWGHRNNDNYWLWSWWPFFLLKRNSLVIKKVNKKNIRKSCDRICKNQTYTIPYSGLCVWGANFCEICKWRFDSQKFLLEEKNSYIFEWVKFGPSILLAQYPMKIGFMSCKLSNCRNFC